LETNIKRSGGFKMKFITIISCIAFLLFSANLLMANLSSGLVAYWQMNGNATDTAGRNDGNIIDNAKFVEDEDRGEVLSTDGAGGHMEVPHSDDIGFISDTTLTISLWVKPSSLPRATYTTIFTKNRDVHYDNSYGIWISPSNKYHFRVGAASGDGTISASDGWHHLLMRHDPITKTLQGFVDGQIAYNNTNASPGVLGDTELRIGAAKDHNTKNIFEPYPGLIDDMAIYKRVLDDAEIQELASGAQIPTAVEPVGKLTSVWGAIKR
jgi:hypothetical protein